MTNTTSWPLGLRPDRFFVLCLGLITLAEALTTLVDPYFGLMLHALVLFGLPLYAGWSDDPAHQKLAIGLTLAPLIRLLSLGMPLINVPQLSWYPIVSIPLLIAVWIMLRHTQADGQKIGLCAGNLPLQLSLAGGGFGLGAIEYAILQPEPIVATLSLQSVWLPALVLLVFTGFTEELIFRGVLQQLAPPVLGRWALVYVSLLFGVLHIGHLSLIDVGFVSAVGLLFAYIVRWSGSILGVTLAHGLTNTTLFVLLPHLAHVPESAAARVMAWLIFGGSLLSLAAILVIVLRLSFVRTEPVLG